jgi:hypothetical protein
VLTSQKQPPGPLTAAAGGVSPGNPGIS